jgi:hypothetical protein
MADHLSDRGGIPTEAGHRPPSDTNHHHGTPLARFRPCQATAAANAEYRSPESAWASSQVIAIGFSPT